jgi:pimeloyl-ACP methyl ester carboxylesterase
MTPPLVLLPGLSCDAAAWRPVADRLPGVECVLPDLPPRRTLGAMAEDLLAALPASFALAGHSMGGRVALEMARRAPQRITHLGLLDTGFLPLAAGQTGEAERAGRYALLDVARRDGMRAMGTKWVQPMVHPDRLADAALIDAILAMIARSTPDRFAREIEALIGRPDASDALAAIACPTLVACGHDDTWSTPAQHREIAARIPGSTLVVFEHCGHMAPMERPGNVARALSELMARSRGGVAGAATLPAAAGAETA